MHSLVIHPSKKFLYAANTFSNDISLFTIASTGALTEVTPRTQVTPYGTSPTLMVMDSTGSYLYVGNIASNNISVFNVDASSGALTQISGSPFSIGTSPLNMALLPGGNFLYVTGGTSTPGFVEVFSISSGTLAFVQVLSAGTSPYGLAIAVNSGGSYLYAANFGDNSISEYSIDTSTGILTELPSSPMGQSSVYSGPEALLVDISNKYLYTANNGTTNLSGYAIGSDGGLTLLTNSPFVTNASPDVIGIDPSGKYLFVGNQKSPAIQAFALDTGSGDLTLVGSYPVPNTPTSIAVTQ